MFPEILKIGPFTVYSYGLMLGVSFIIASYLLTKEVERRKLYPNLATEITLLAIIFGIIGSKLFHLFENWSEFLKNPVEMAFSPGGLTFYGGLIVASIAIFIYSRKKRVPFLVVADTASPSLALAYGIGRIGCHLAGDGDYGNPTTLPWGVNYANGTVKPHRQLADYFQRNPDMADKYDYHNLSTEILGQDDYGTITAFDTTVNLHPTPIYEFIGAFLIFLLLWNLRKKNWIDGKLFMIYLILSGAARLSVEFIRMNPRILMGLTEAQLISIFLIASGITGFVILSRKKDEERYIPPVIKPVKKKK
jgi:phosphatidylglycerol---prolipoprotein diacylglyceryl transferase